jgi:hypothetical protein
MEAFTHALGVLHCPGLVTFNLNAVAVAEAVGEDQDTRSAFPAVLVSYEHPHAFCI